MSDYRLIIRVKNNLLHTLMKREGIETQGELARVTGLSTRTIGDIANLKIGAFNANGSASSATEKLCNYFGCLPEDIYPPEVLHVGIPNNVIERVVSSEEVTRYLNQKELDPAYQLENMIDSEFVMQQLNRLTPRQKQVIEARFYSNKTCEEIGADMGITGGRVRQIELNALRKLRDVLWFEKDKPGLDSTAGGLATRLADAVKKENLIREKSL